MGDSEKGRSVLGVAGDNTAPAFEVEHGVFHPMTKLVEMLVVVALDQPMLSRRDDGSHGLPGSLLEEGIGVVASFGKQVVSRYPLDQGASLRAISGGT